MAVRTTCDAAIYKVTMLAAIVLFVLAGSAATGSSAELEQQGAPPGIPDLVGGLKAIEGCLGVETAMTASGKQVIFAWFEDKAAVLRWYHSDMHRGVQQAFFPNQEYGTPLESVPDDIGPIMAVASITMADKAQFEATSLPISQIAIELYTPVTGGLFLGGRFAPDSLKVPNLKDYTPRP